MNYLSIGTLAMYGAGAIHWAGVVVNVTAPWVYAYRKNLPGSDAMRQIFVGQAVWVTIMLAAMGGVCVKYGTVLCSSVGLGHYLAVFLLVLWVARLIMQIAFYRSDTRVAHPARYFIFLSAFTYQVVVFGAAAFGVLA